MGSLHIDVFNPPFVINVNKDDEYLQKLLWYYKKIIEKIKKNGSLKNPLQISALAGIMICDELYMANSQVTLLKNSVNQTAAPAVNTQDDEEAERLTKMMIEKIEKALDS